MPTARRTTSLIAAALTLSMVASCGGSPAASVASPVTEAEARAMTENMLEAYNAGDYAAWSRDWSQTMKDAIPEAAFETFRGGSIAETGNAVSLDSIVSRPGDNPGVTRWESTVTFENGTWVLMLAFNEGSKLIDGVNLSRAP